MKKLNDDPLRGKNGSVRFDYRFVTETGVRIEGQTRALRMNLEQWQEFNAFLGRLYQGTPELLAMEQERKARKASQ